jgi:hypothetical protein
VETITVAQGRTLPFLVQIRDTAERNLTGHYDGSEPLTLRVWPGGRRMAIALSGSGVAWGGTDDAGTVYSADDGVVTVTLDDADTATLDPGSYQLTATVTDGGEPRDFYRAVLQVTPSPGQVAVPATYSGYEDMQAEASWVGELLDFDVDQSGFAGQRGSARKWFEGVLHAHYRGASAYAGGQLAGTIGLTWRSGRRSKWLQDLLDADRLVLTPEIVRACSLYALATVLRPQIGTFKGTSYQALAAQFAGMAEDVAAGIVAEVDTNADGQGDIEIELGTVDVLRG